MGRPGSVAARRPNARSCPGARRIGWFAPPAPFVLWLLACAGIVLVLSGWLGKRLPAGPEAMASRVGYPGLVLMTGIGWLLLLDLSANGHFGNRYLALYHQGHLWLGMLILSVLVFLRQPLGRLLGWCLSVLDGVTSAIGSRVSRGMGGGRDSSSCSCCSSARVGSSLTNIRQLTSELGRVWLIVGAAWFFYLRGTPLAERMARGDGSIASLVRYVWPLWFVVLALIGTMLMTRDMGPLLIAGYGAGAFVAASVAMWWHQRHRATYAGLRHRRRAVRAVDPGDHLRALRAGLARRRHRGPARESRGADGFGERSARAGALVPERGAALRLRARQRSLVRLRGRQGCAGVPAQIQSDYTFTALVGAFGWTFAWAMTLGCAVWLHRLVRHHGRVTRGEPRLVVAGDRVVNDDQAFLSWLAVAWVVLALCQLAVTVAGNLAVLPLTGVTFPFVSFGMTSLLVNMAMLALCLHINLPRRIEDA